MMVVFTKSIYIIDNNIYISILNINKTIGFILYSNLIAQFVGTQTLYTILL